MQDSRSESCIFPIREQARIEPAPLLGYIAALQDVAWRQDRRAAEGCGLWMKDSAWFEDIILISVRMLCRDDVAFQITLPVDTDWAKGQRTTG